MRAQTTDGIAMVRDGVCIQILLDGHSSATEMAEFLSRSLKDGDELDYELLQGRVEFTFDGAEVTPVKIEPIHYEMVRIIRNELMHGEIAKVVDDDISARKEMQRVSESQDQPPDSAIVLPPGMKIANVLKAILGPIRFKRYVAPAIADMQEEYFEALSRRDRRGAWLALIRGYLYLIPGWLWASAAAAIAKAYRSK